MGRLLELWAAAVPALVLAAVLLMAAERYAPLR
jgi:hypothetical protein